MRFSAALPGLFCSVLIMGCNTTVADPHRHRSVDGERIPTGRSIATTRPGAAITDVGSLPMNLIASPDGNYAISTDMGFRQSLCSIRIADGQLASRIPFDKSPNARTNGLYYGLAFGPDGTLYAAQGGFDAIAVLSLGADGTLEQKDTIHTGRGDFPAGLACDARGYLFATSNDPLAVESVVGAPGAVITYDTKTGNEIGRYKFEGTFYDTTNFPLAIAILRDGSKLFVASQRDGCVFVLDSSDAAHLKLMTSISTGAHPGALLLNRKQTTLYVANADSDTVSIVDVASNTVKRTILLRPPAAKDLAGASPVGLALSPDEKTLYAALGDMNAVAVIDLQENEVEGYLPTGWYPTAVLARDEHLLVVNAKGSRNQYPNPRVRQQSPLNLLEGNVQRIDLPDDLDEPTRSVLELARLTPAHLVQKNPLAQVGIKHVVYIIKENRTYDQVLGDLPQGNGDPSRCLFGREITPNQHALAERFVLLDNFYDSGEVSGDGWVWSTQAMANEYVIRNVPYEYSNRGRTFDYEGVNHGYPTGGFPAKGPDGEALSGHPQLKNGAAPIPDVAASPGGHLWDICIKHGVSFRNYGVFVGSSAREDGVDITPDNYPSVRGLQPPGHDLAGVTDIDFRRFDLSYADSDAPQRYYEQTGDETFLRKRNTYGKHEARSRFEEWNTEFQMMLAKDPTGGAVPQMMFVRFPVDHTEGVNAGIASPKSMVADNDYAVGQLVEAISHSPIWKDTAIFIIEDDAQNGPDHVDAHRSTCYVISPWIKRASVDHTFHNTVSCMRTMELLLGLPPMCQYDAAADPILNWDRSPTNVEPYSAILPAAELIKDRNPKKNPTTNVSPEGRVMNELIERSEAMNFAQADQAPADQLNVLIWKSVCGADSKLPPTPNVLPGFGGAKEEEEE